MLRSSKLPTFAGSTYTWTGPLASPGRHWKGKPFDSILTFVDRLWGMCHFVPVRAADTAEDTAIHLINAVIKHHGCPAKIIADNDTRLRAGFWEALTGRLGIQMRHIRLSPPV